ncbi:hypothetical protein [Ilumatobacter nonamiensis]|uniref:hypothetical protein n=1 Tax=Ilumatobacter nonamiensis TaxID=467093 RepID=UPI0011D27CFA|nr:hypothetical protein [Ilumatobacter nonamiensis]
MDDDPVLIHLDLTRAGDSLTGHARNDQGTTRPFSGRLGLLAALDALVAEAETQLPGADHPGPTKSTP